MSGVVARAEAARGASRPRAREATLERFVEFFEQLTPAGLAHLGDVYAADARFVDPFNEVVGIAAIEGIFRHMYRQVAEPRFVVCGVFPGAGAEEAMLRWEFHYRRRAGAPWAVIRGSSYLRFEAGGKVCLHQDYWDAAGELYARLPGVGLLMRWLARQLAAP